MRALIATIISILFSTFCYAQTRNDVQQSALGVHFFINDFPSGDSSIKNKPKPGIAVSFMTGISVHLDFVAMIAGSFPDFSGQDNSNSSEQSNHLLLETDGAIRYKLLSNKYWILPYAQAGLGFSKYSNSYGAYLPAGIGVQIKLFEEAYFI